MAKCVEKLNRQTTTVRTQNIFVESFRQDYVIDK